MPSIFLTPSGMGYVLQVAPPSAVATASFSSEVTAQQWDESGQDIASRPRVPAGRASFTQCPEPGLEPFVNASISPVLVVTSPFLLTKEPAAQHAVILGHATA